jgi:hypothetical protein
MKLLKLLTVTSSLSLAGLITEKMIINGSENLPTISMAQNDVQEALSKTD